jgi:SAM-dependent methyltransferase
MTACPSCGGKNTRVIGPIPFTNLFAGKISGEAAIRSSLYRCFSCRLRFRWPRLPADIMDRLYLSDPEGSLQYQKRNRTDWKIAEKWLAGFPRERSILDIGCADGEFLNSLNWNWKKFGIEINEKATGAAQGRGVSIISRNMNETNGSKYMFGAVTAFDVIEHVENPALFFKSLLRMTRPGGWVILSSGNSESPSWRLMGGGYWYCLFSDHISFINEKWCRHEAGKMDAEVVAIEYFSHADRTGLLSFGADLVKNVLYRIFPGLFGAMRKRGFGGIDLKRNPELACSPPYWKTAKDHLIVLFRKKS